MVIIEVGCSIFVFGNSLVEKLLIVHIALFHSQDTVQLQGGINRVAYPGDVAEVVFLTFVNLHIDINMFGVYIPNAVFQKGSIAITIFVVFLDEVLLVGSPAFRRELLCLEERAEFACLVDFGKGTFLEQTTFNLR